jgi:hypothetical protein
MITKKHNLRAIGCVNSFVACGVATALALMSPSSVAQGASASAANSSQYVKGSLCTRPDQVVFSCPLAKNGKIVSICAAGNASPHKFYYAFGKPSSVEMRYPSSPSGSSGAFLHSFLGYPGGTGGYAYSFVKNEIKYIVFYLSGAYGYVDGGVAVQKSGVANAMANMECSKGKIYTTQDDPLLNETIKWKTDDDLEGHVVPTLK